MTDRTLPHATAVANEAVAKLNASGEHALAEQLAKVHRATCDFVHHLHAEREASTQSAFAQARHRAEHALLRLRKGATA